MPLRTTFRGRLRVISGMALIAIVASADVTVAAESAPPLDTASVIVEVQQKGQRVGDKMPARLAISAAEFFRDETALIDPSSIKVERIAYEGGESTVAVAARFDGTDPAADSFFYQHIGGAASNGHVVFQHIASGGLVGRYKLSVRRWIGRADEAPASPAPQLGDFDMLRYEAGPLSGIFHTKLALADWDNDGYRDILAGDGLGRITLYRRMGRDLSKFHAPTFITAGGKPLDTLWTAAPDVVDWDGDGDLDVISGEEAKGGVLYFDNVGSRDDPELTDGTPLVDRAGNAIISPHEPVAEMSFYKKDYSPCPRAVDYNGDGKLDLVLGGYVSGQMFYYENVAATAHERPRLEFRGRVVDEDRAPIDVTWCATPELADLDADGDLDLISGHIGERKDRFGWRDAPSVLYWKNVGRRGEPRWRQRPFPLEERWTRFMPDVPVPRLADWDGDGDLDMLMGARCEAFRFENVGSKTEPKFEFRERLSMPGGPFLTNFSLNAVAPCLGDINGDGMPDLLRGGSGDVPLALMTSFGNTPTFDDVGLLEAGEDTIYIPFTHGDDTTFPFLFEWDADGDLDLLLGDGDGFVWFYRNEGDAKQWQFAAGLKLKLHDGQDLCAGTPTPKEAKDFTQHSGNRVVPAPADYDGDGRPDLICSNALGKVFFYRNAGQDRFDAGVEIASGTGRCFSCPADWNADGKPDVILSWARGPMIYLNRGMGPGSAPNFDAVSAADRMPWLPMPRPMVADWDRDGDSDLLLASSYALLHFASRNFIEQGYVEARIVNE
jgi:FG-GAP-like repeat